jgi:hypothetical protein
VVQLQWTWVLGYPYHAQPTQNVSNKIASINDPEVLVGLCYQLGQNVSTRRRTRVCKFHLTKRVAFWASERGSRVWYADARQHQSLMQNRIVSVLAVTLGIAIFLSAGPLAAQPSPTPTCTPQLFMIPQAPTRHEVPNQVYAPSVTTDVYLVNFLLLYIANPDLAAYMPA